MKHLFKIPGRSGQNAKVSRRSPAVETPASHAGRRILLDRIGNFLQDHALEVSPANLNLAHAAFSGGNSRLQRRIAERELADQPITQAWLDGLPGNNARDGKFRQDMDLLIDRLDTLLQQFLHHASNASTAAARYHLALADFATRLEPASQPAATIATLAELTDAMAEHSRQIADEMQRSEISAEAMCQSLDHARHHGGSEDLTDPTDREAFETILQAEYRAARQAAQPLSIAICDIHGIRLIADTHGPDVGDRVIKAVSRALQRLSGPHGHVIRLDGGKLVLLFRGLTPDLSRDELDKVRESFAHRHLIDRQTEATIGTVTFSAGVADGCAYGDPATALQAAQDALNRANEQGHNRIEVATPVL